MSENYTIEDECNMQFIAALKNALNVVNGKWKLAIVATLLKKQRRFNEIERLLPGITPKMISKELKELELNKVIMKVQKIDEISGRSVVLYDLTDSGKGLEKLMVQMATWGQQHKELNALSNSISKVTI